MADLAGARADAHGIWPAVEVVVKSSSPQRIALRRGGAAYPAFRVIDLAIPRNWHAGIPGIAGCDSHEASLKQPRQADQQMPRAVELMSG